MTLSRAFVRAWVAFAICLVFAALWAQTTGWEQPGVGGIIARLIGRKRGGARLIRNVGRTTDDIHS
jgi:hypothetical protein